MIRWSAVREMTFWMAATEQINCVAGWIMTCLMAELVTMNCLVKMELIICAVDPGMTFSPEAQEETH